MKIALLALLLTGSRAPHTKVRVQVDAMGAGPKPLSSDAALFTFTPHVGKALDFFLSSTRESSDCASSNLACGTDDQCVQTTAKTGNEAPDMTTTVPPTTTGSLVSSQPGLVEATAGQTYSIDRPETEPGDLLVDGTEAGNATLFDFTAPIFSQNSSGRVIDKEYVFRGAVAPLQAVMGHVVTSDDTTNITPVPMNAGNWIYPFVLSAAAQ